MATGRVDLTDAPTGQPLPAMPRPASAAQSGIWVNELLDDLLAVHHVPFIVDFDGDLDVAALRRASAAVLRRHPVLTSAVEDRDGAPFLVPAPVPPELITERALVTERAPAAEPEPAAARDLVGEPAEPDAEREFVVAPFDLARGPLCRLVLRATGPGRHRLLVVAHHLVFDGRSIEVFVADLAECYRAELQGGAAELPELGPDEPAAAEEARIAAGLPAARRYWAEHPLGDGDVQLPGLDRPVQGVQPGESVQFRLPDSLREALGPVAQRLGVTRFELFMASVHALLYRYGNQTPATALDLGTRTPEQRDRIGVHVNELPFCSAPRAGTTFADFATQVRAGLRELYRVREVPLGRVGVGVRPGVALAPVSLTYVRQSAAPHFPGVTASAPRVLFNHTARNALRIQLFDGPGVRGVPDGAGVLRAVLQYPPRSLSRDGAQSIGRHWLTLLAHAVAAPHTPLAELPLLDAAERDTVLVGWNDTAVAYPARTVSQLVAEQTARTPDAVAVLSGDRRLTYAELDAAAQRLAGRLRTKGIGTGSLVAVRATRSERLVVALLGVLKAGAAYIPLDADYPAQRLDFIAADSKVALELSDADLVLDDDVALATDGVAAGAGDATPDARDATANAGDVTRPADGATVEPAAPAPAPGDLAYVIYTSGSTGRPKGVQVEHRALTNLLLSMRDLLGAGPGHTWLALTSVSFDISGLELFLPLVTGGSVVVATDSQVRDGAALCELACRHGVTHVQATPTGWAMLLDGGFDAPHGTALAGGEALPAPLARRLRPRVGRVLNVYGPTETTIWSTAAALEPADVDADRVPIGRPLANTRVYVLDERLAPVPVGIPGDLYIGGAGLARGYLGRPRLDSERFVADPFGPPGQRMYRTGDRVRRRGDGQLEFLGRVDDQIKLRGHRIELGEIESRLLAVPGVQQAAAAVRDGALVGYHVGPAEPGELRRTLAVALPAYMVPESFVRLDALPTTPNGKLDRSALPFPSQGEPAPGAGSGGVLDTVREIWCEVLRLPELGDTENLFDLGGHSVTMTQISARIRARLGVDVPLYAYFDEPTVAGIAAVVTDLQIQRNDGGPNSDQDRLDF